MTGPTYQPPVRHYNPDTPLKKISQKFAENSSEGRLDNLTTNGSHTPPDITVPKSHTPTEAPSTSFAQRIADLLGPDGKLKPEERQRHMDNGLCLCCGEPGHMVTDCPQNNMPGPLKGRAVSATLQVLTPEALEPLQSRNPSRFHIPSFPLIFFLSHLSLTSFSTFHFLSTPLPEPLPHLFALYLHFLLFAILLLLHLFRFSSEKNSFSASYTTSNMSFSSSMYL